MWLRNKVVFDFGEIKKIEILIEFDFHFIKYHIFQNIFAYIQYLFINSVFHVKLFFFKIRFSAETIFLFILHSFQNEINFLHT